MTIGYAPIQSQYFPRFGTWTELQQAMKASGFTAIEVEDTLDTLCQIPRWGMEPQRAVKRVVELLRQYPMSDNGVEFQKLVPGIRVGQPSFAGNWSVPPHLMLQHGKHGESETQHQPIYI